MIISTYVKLSAINDINGNPRRVFLVYENNTEKNWAGGELVAVVDVKHRGNSVVYNKFPNVLFIGEYHVTPAVYRNWLKVGQSEGILF